VRRLKTKAFARWARKARVADADLLEAARELERGLFAAQLGADLYKVGISRPSSGKRSGYRTTVAHKAKDRLIYVYGFAKNERDNIDTRELEAFKKLTKQYLCLSPAELDRAAALGYLIELE
jgi:hypothetical protein